MTSFYSLNSPELQSEQINALNAIDLQLYFGNHGYHDVIPGQGMAETRLEDVDFAGMQPLIDSFDASRGDVFSREGLGYQGQWNVSEYMDTLSWSLQSSPYATQSDREILGLPAHDSAYITDENILDRVDTLRALQLINPIDYASIHATAKGVECLYADVSYEEESAWWNEAEKIADAYPDFMVPYLRYKSAKAEFAFRNTQIVSKLGFIALAMPIKNETPVLSYAVGGRHAAGIEQVLQEHDIAYTANRFSPDRSARYRRDTLRDIAHLVVPKIDSSDIRYKKIWVANAQRQTKNRLA